MIKLILRFLFAFTALISAAQLDAQTYTTPAVSGGGVWISQAAYGSPGNVPGGVTHNTVGGSEGYASRSGTALAGARASIRARLSSA